MRGEREFSPGFGEDPGERKWQRVSIRTDPRDRKEPGGC